GRDPVARERFRDEGLLELPHVRGGEVDAVVRHTGVLKRFERPPFRRPWRPGHDRSGSRWSPLHLRWSPPSGPRVAHTPPGRTRSGRTRSRYTASRTPT